MKHLVWDNDVCSMYDAIQEEPTEFFPEIDEEDITNSMMWNEAYEQIERNLGDEQMNLDIEKENHIFLMGILQRWNGSYPAYKDLETCNIGDALLKAIQSFDGDNSFEIYVEGKRLLIAQRGHDNPCSPSIMEFRVLKDCYSLDDFKCNHEDTVKNMMKHSKSLATDVRNVYGWTTKRKVVVT